MADVVAPTLATTKTGAYDWTELILPLACVAILWQAPMWGLALIPLAIVSIGLERLAPYREQRILRAGWKTDIYHAMLTRTYAIAFSVVIVAGLESGIEAAARPAILALRQQPGWLLAVEAIILADLFAYLEHRACHRYELLWRFHRIHHIGEDLDWLSRFRNHPLDITVLGVVELLPFYVLGTPAWASAAFAVVVYYNGTFSHSNINVSLGRLWWIVKNPEYHRWHHAKERIAANKNFCELFPIWDVLFHTNYMPRDRKPKALGVPGNDPIGYIDQMIVPFVPDRRRKSA